MGVTDVRTLLLPLNPFVLSKYPSRPAPAHLLNGFVSAALGTSDRGPAIRKLIEAKDPHLDSFDFLAAAEWAKDPETLLAFQADMAVAFNPDRRVWEEKGSPVPVHAAMLSPDPSDDGLGRKLWDVVRVYRGRECAKRLRALLLPAEPEDPVTACAVILTRGASELSAHTPHPSQQAWFGEGGTPVGKLFARNLADFLLRLTEPHSDARRLLQIQHLGRGLYFGAVLALLVGQVLASRRQVVESVDEVASIVVWADTPPGPTNHPLVEASARSLQLLIEQQLATLTSQLKAALLSFRLSNVPASQRRRRSLERQLLLGGASGTKVDRMIEQLCADARTTASGDRPASGTWYRDLVESGYAPSFLTQGLRSMGTKLGFIGPDRGAGIPRFVCETPLLGTLVSGMCPPEGMDFEDFVDQARWQFGLVFGLGTDDGVARRLSPLWESVGVGRGLLRENQEALRQRLVRAGLAREYSDGHTEVPANG